MTISTMPHYTRNCRMLIWGRSLENSRLWSVENRRLWLWSVIKSTMLDMRIFVCMLYMHACCVDYNVFVHVCIPQACIYVYIYIYVCVCMYLHIYRQVVYMYVYTCKCMYVCMYVCVYIYTYIHIYRQMPLPKLKGALLHACV